MTVCANLSLFSQDIYSHENISIYVYYVIMSDVNFKNVMNFGKCCKSFGISHLP